MDSVKLTARITKNLRDHKPDFIAESPVLHSFKTANGKSFSESVYHGVGEESNQRCPNGNMLIFSFSYSCSWIFQ